MKEDFLIKEIADHILVKCPDHDSFSIGNIIDTLESEDMRNKAKFKYYDKIILFLTGEGYIERPVNQNVRFKLTKKGKQTKQKGGISKFSKYERNLSLKKEWYDFGKDYILVIISIIISVVSYVNSINKDLEVRITALENKNIELEKRSAQNLKELNELKLIKNKNK